mgnify:CR=1 FL=1
MWHVFPVPDALEFLQSARLVAVTQPSLAVTRSPTCSCCAPDRGRRITSLVREDSDEQRDLRGPLSVELAGDRVVEATAGLHGFRLLRLNGSAFKGFVRDEYTTLPERGIQIKLNPDAIFESRCHCDHARPCEGRILIDRLWPRGVTREDGQIGSLARSYAVRPSRRYDNCRWATRSIPTTHRGG